MSCGAFLKWDITLQLCFPQVRPHGGVCEGGLFGGGVYSRIYGNASILSCAHLHMSDSSELFGAPRARDNSYILYTNKLTFCSCVCTLDSDLAWVVSRSCTGTHDRPYLRHGLHYQHHPCKCVFVLIKLCVFFPTGNWVIKSMYYFVINLFQTILDL